MKPTNTKRPTDAEVVSDLHKEHDALELLANALRNHGNEKLAQEAERIAGKVFWAADALEAASAEPFAAKVRRATAAAVKSSAAFCQRFTQHEAERIIAAALRAAGVEG